MKKWFKRIVMAAVVLLIAAFIGVAVFILNIDPSAYKNKLAQMIKAQYHRELIVDGDIELSLFPRIGLTVNNISLSEPHQQDVFTHIDKVRIAVALWPLMSNRFLVDHLAIEGFSAHIIRDENGHYNIDDLLHSSLDQSTRTDTTLSWQKRLEQTDFKVDIAGLTLNNGQLSYQDNAQNTHLILDKMSLRTGRITQGQAFDLALNAQLKDLQGDIQTQLNVEGLMLLKPLKRTYEFNRLNAMVQGKWKALQLKQAQLKGNVSINTASNALVGSEVDLNILAEGVQNSGIRSFTTTLVAPRLEYSVSDLSLAMKSLRFESSLERTDKQSLSLAFQAPELKISPDGAGADPLKGELILKSAAQQLKLGFALDNITGNALAMKVADLTLTGEYQIGKAKALGLQLTSAANFSVLDQWIDLPKVSGTLVLPQAKTTEIPLSGALRLAPKQTDFQLTAHLQDEMHLHGNVRGFFHPKVSFDLQGDYVDLNVLFQQGKGLSLTEFKALSVQEELLSRLSGLGTFNFKKALFNDTVLEKLGATLIFNHSDIQVKSLKADLYGGELRANGEYAVNEQSLKGDMTLKDIELETLTREWFARPLLTGKAQANIMFQAKGSSSPTLLNSLTAQLEMSAPMVRVQGIDLQKVLQEPKEYLDPWSLSTGLSFQDGASTLLHQWELKGQLANQQFQWEKWQGKSPAFQWQVQQGADYHLGTQYLYLPMMIKAKKSKSVSLDLPLLLKGKIDDVQATLFLEKWVP